MTKTIPEQLFRLADEDPGRESLVVIYPGQDDQIFNRGQLSQAVQRAAGHLARVGAGRGDLVVIVQNDLLLLTATFFGAGLLGAIPSILPFATEKLHPDRYKAAMSALIEVSSPAVLVTETALAQQVQALLPPEAEGVALPRFLVLDPVQVMEGGLPSRPEDVAPDPGDIALLQHSSGTTGLQKGVALSHRAIFEQLDAYSRSLDFTPDDVVVSWLPLYHDMGLIAGFLMPLLMGARLVIMTPLDWVRAPQMMLQAISDYGGTLCWLPNFAYNFCAQKIRDEDLSGINLESVRAFINCSEPIYDESHSLFAGRFAPFNVDPGRLATCYAMAETVFAVSQSELGAPARVDVVDREALRSQQVAQPVASDSPVARRLVSSGRPIEGMEISVLDENRRPLPDRHLGELAVRSSYMLTAYYRRPDATEAAFHGDWYLTGDIGYVADGEVYVLGRKKDLIIIGGRNIYPRDIEMLVSGVDGVHPGRVVAFGVPNPERGTEDLAVIAEIDVPDGEKGQIAADIRRTISKGTDVAVRYIELVPRGWLVKTSSGKVARSANREKFIESIQPA